MNKKDLIRHIKQKASEVEIKDFSKEIILKAQSIPRETIEVKEPKRRLFSHPLLQMSLVTIVGLFIMMFVIQPSNQIYAFEEQDQVFASSAITSLSYLDSNREDLSLSSISTLNTYVNDELDDVILFAELSERLLSTYQIEKSENASGYDVQLTFETTDLLNVTQNYIIKYNEIKEKKNQYSYIGVIEINAVSYAFNAEVKRGSQNEFSYEIIHENHLIELRYQYKTDGYLYQFNYYKDQVLAQAFQMKELKIDDQRHVMVDFREGVSKGIYTFSILRQNNQSYLRARYLISKDETEDGEITIRPSSSEAYEIEISPRGQAPIIIERGRRPHQNDDFHPGHQGNM